jgi:hypothetical protein
MRTSRLISAVPAAAVAAALLAGPAGAASQAPGPPTWPKHPAPVTEVVPRLPGPPTWPKDPKPISPYHASVAAADGGFDWESGGIGAAAGIAALATGLAGAAGVRRRRILRSRPLTTS